MGKVMGALAYPFFIIQPSFDFSHIFQNTLEERSTMADLCIT
jgi:hypothetical protein